MIQFPQKLTDLNFSEMFFFATHSAEKRRIVLERAVKLREQRKESKAKQEIIQKRREEAFQRYKYVFTLISAIMKRFAK